MLSLTVSNHRFNRETPSSSAAERMRYSFPETIDDLNIAFTFIIVTAIPQVTNLHFRFTLGIFAAYCVQISGYVHRRDFPDILLGPQSSSIFLFFRKILSTSKWRIFRVSKGGANSASRKILREKLELHSTSKKSLNIAKMVEKRFERPTSTHDLSYEKIRLADCHKIPIFSDKSENPHARVTGVHKFLTFTPPSVPGDNREASHQEMKPL